MTVRPLVESDRPAMLQIARICFNVPPEWVRTIGPELRLDRWVGAEANGRLVGIAADYDVGQWIHGRSVRCSGVGTVAVVPEHRAAGNASRLVEELLRRAGREGMPLAALYPATTRVYRGLGYELSGVRSQFRLRIADIPAGLPAGDCEVEESGFADLGPIQRCYNRFVSRHTGPLESAAEDWWRRRVFRLWSEAPVRAVVVRRRGAGADIEGYATFQIDAVGGTWSYDVNCGHLVALTPAATAALFRYFRGFRGLGQSVSWYGPPAEPLALWLAAGAEDVTPIRVQHFMNRIVDVPGALAERGWAGASGAATFRVRDALFPRNEGPWRLEVSDGQARVERAEAASGCTLPVGALAALCTGHLSVEDAHVLGLVEADGPQRHALARLFPAGSPWMPDIF